MYTHFLILCKIDVKCLEDELSSNNTWPLMTASTSKVHGHWPVNYAVVSIRNRGRWVLHAEFSCKPFPFYIQSNRANAGGHLNGKFQIWPSINQTRQGKVMHWKIILGHKNLWLPMEMVISCCVESMSGWKSQTATSKRELLHQTSVWFIKLVSQTISD